MNQLSKLINSKEETKFELNFNFNIPMNSFFDLTHTLYFLLRERAMSLLLTQVWKVFIFIQIIGILIQTIITTYIPPYSPDVPTLRLY